MLPQTAKVVTRPLYTPYILIFKEIVITIYIFFVHPCIRKDSFAKRDFVIKFKIIILSDIIAFCLYLLHILGIVHPFITPYIDVILRSTWTNENTAILNKIFIFLLVGKVSEVDSRVTPTHPGFRNAK
jgi:hypothetical protein